MTLEAYSLDLIQGTDGVWTVSEHTPVYFPEEGNQLCSQIEEESFWFQHRNSCLCSIVKNYPPAGPIFDVGAGNGFVGLALKKANFESIAVEPGPSGAERARARGLEVICATFEDAKFRDGSLPSIGMFDVLEHIETDEKFLSLMRTKLVPEGRIYLTVPAYNGLWSEDDVYAGHFRRYTTGTLRRVLENAGLKVEFETYLFACLVPPIFLFRTIPHFFGKKLEHATERYGKNHLLPKGIIGGVIQRSLNWELDRISSGGAIGFGSSCCIVAKRTN